MLNQYHHNSLQIVNSFNVYTLYLLQKQTSQKSTMNMHMMPALEKLNQLIGFGIDWEAAQAAVIINPNADIQELMIWAVDEYPKFKQANQISMSQTPFQNMSMNEPKINNFNIQLINNGSSQQNTPLLTDEQLQQKLMELLDKALQIREAHKEEEKQNRINYLKEIGETEESAVERFRKVFQEEDRKREEDRIKQAEADRLYWIEYERRQKIKQAAFACSILYRCLKAYWKLVDQPIHDEMLRNQLAKEQAKRKYRQEHPEQFQGIEEEKLIQEPPNEMDSNRVELPELTEAQQYEFQQLIKQCNKVYDYRRTDREVANNFMQTMIMIIENIANYPKDEKFRKLKKSNSTVQNKILRYPSVLSFMNWVGFEEHQDMFYMEEGIKDQTQFKFILYILNQYRNGMMMA